MKATFYGTRGSTPIFDRESLVFGGRTTCVQIESDCLPVNHWLIVDSGTGIVPLGRKACKSGVTQATILYTHWHPDHFQGLFLCPMLFNPNIQLNCIGPVELGVGPEQKLRHELQPPHFPVSYQEQAHHISCTSIENPASRVIIIHPEGGVKMVDTDKLAKAESSRSKQIRLNGSGLFKLSECLIVKMIYANHPQRTISYRFEERPTGRTFVFLTDHENEDPDALSVSLKKHLGNKVDLLVMDSQYSREIYPSKAGFGHGTADYCANVAVKCGVSRLGLTHHDDNSNDEQIYAIEAAAKQYMFEHCGEFADVFACADDQIVEV